MKRKYVLITAITLLAAFLRFNQLGRNPPSLNLDEVAIGYNAYSILKTGMDEYGTRFPIAFRSHDDYKAPLYIYLTTIPIKLFGLKAFAVRFISALAGTLSIPLFYLLCQEFFSGNKDSNMLSAISSLLLAISPWHLQFSRAAFETNLALFLTIFGVFAYLKGLGSHKWLYVSASSFALSLYAYHSSKLFLPLFGLVLTLNARKQILKRPKQFFLPLVLFLLLVLPLIPFSLSKEGRLRFKGTNVFSTPTLVNANQQQKIDQWRLGRPLQAKLFHNQYLTGAMTLADGYFSHFTYEFLFHGEYGPPKNFSPNSGLLYPWQLPAILVGAYYLFRKNHQHKWIILTWLMFSPLASALTYDVPSSTRTTLIIPTFQILTAMGVVYLVPKGKTTKVTYSLSSFLVIIFFFLHYLHNYYHIAPQKYSKAWQYGYKKAVKYTQKHYQEYKKIVVSTSLKQPQNFWAFYLQYDPFIYIHQDGGTVSGGWAETRNKFDKFIFTPFRWQKDQLEPNTLYVGLAREAEPYFHQNAKQVINLLNKKPELVIYALE